MKFLLELFDIRHHHRSRATISLSVDVQTDAPSPLSVPEVEAEAMDCEIDSFHATFEGVPTMGVCRIALATGIDDEESLVDRQRMGDDGGIDFENHDDGEESSSLVDGYHALHGNAITSSATTSTSSSTGLLRLRR